MLRKLPVRLAVILIPLIFIVMIPAPLLAAEKVAQKAVLVTGASTGIGRRITEVFAAEGYFVYAGARKQKDIDSLNAIENVQAIELDVTVQEQIDAAVKTVTKGGRGLWGLINNAGVYIGGPIADVAVEEYEWIMDVNVTGVYRVTQAFMPMIIESGGRISTVGSISGINSGRFNGPYSMSKHAIEAFTDSLAAEMAMVGVKVSVIEPGNYASAIGTTAQERMVRKKEAYEKKGSPFAEEYGEWISEPWGRDQYKEPDEVAEAALHAMFAEEPLVRYMVVPAEPEGAWAIDKLIEEVVQLNQWQAYTYSRDELVAKLDAASVSQADVDEITELLNSFLANSGKADAHERFWAGDLVYTSSDGSRTSRSEIMQSFSDGEEKESLSTTVYSGEDINVQLFGTTAVVTFRLVGTPDDGSPVLNYFNTGTFLKRNGEWRAVAWQATVIPQG
jgi:NAD(P)-dependent dehydrogenase (short-subunit alcohol dehydrogenase family)